MIAKMLLPELVLSSFKSAKLIVCITVHWMEIAIPKTKVVSQLSMVVC